MSNSEYAIFSALIFMSLLASCCVFWIVVAANAPRQNIKPWKLCGYHMASYSGPFSTTVVDSDYCEVCKDYKSLRPKKPRKLTLVK